MSLHHSFRQPAHTGFTRSVDPRAARRQFQVSAAVVAALAVALVVSIIAIGPATGYDTGRQAANMSAASALGRPHVNALSATPWTRG